MAIAPWTLAFHCREAVHLDVLVVTLVKVKSSDIFVGCETFGDAV